MRLRFVFGILAALGGLAPLSAHAVDFTLDKSVDTGMFTLTNNSTTYSIDELVVSGLGTTARIELAPISWTVCGLVDYASASAVCMLAS